MSHEDRLLTESHLVVLEVLLVADYSSPRESPSVRWDWDTLLRGAGLLSGGESVRVRETMTSIDMSEVLRQRDAAKAETRRLLEGEPAGDLEQAVDMLCNDASARGVRIVMGPHRTLTPDDIRRAVGMLASSRQLALEKRDAALEDAEWHRKRCEELRHQVRVQSDENLRVKLEKREDWKAACEAALAASNLVGLLKARVAELEAAVTPKSVSLSNAEGLRTDRVTLEVTQRTESYAPLSYFDWTAMLRSACRGRLFDGESVRVVAITCGDGGCGPARSGQNSGQAELEAAAGTAGGDDAVVVPQTVVAGNFAQIHWNTCCRLHRMAMDKAGVRWTQSTEPSRPESEEAGNAGGEVEG